MLNREYDPFARLYNRQWGADYRAEAFPVVDRLLLSRLKPGASVLDVCCGTGQFTALTMAQAGIDSSPEMIRYAQENAPNAEFTVADVRDFSLGCKFDAAYSVFESLNHVPNLEDLNRAFRNVRKHLRPRGWFLFDLNREEAFTLYWNTLDAIVRDDSVCVLRMNYDEETRIGTCEVTEFSKTEFSKDTAWTRSDYTLRQTCHDPGQAQQALFGAGFRNVALYDARDAGMSGDAGHGRMFFLAQA